MGCKLQDLLATSSELLQLKTPLMMSPCINKLGLYDVTKTHHQHIAT